MKLFLVYLQSPEQIRSFSRLEAAIAKQSGINIFLVTRFKLQGQSEYSQIQYSRSLEKLTGLNILVVPELFMAKLFSLLIKSALLKKKLSFIIGNFSEFYGKTVYERLINSEIIVVDDGADVISVANVVALENKHSNLTFFSKYENFIHWNLRNSKYLPENGITYINQNVSSKILGVLGGPYVELEGLGLERYENFIMKIMKYLDCDEVYYFMHRRENPKFANLQIHEYIDEDYSSIELLDHLSIIPAIYWTFTSSALLDIFLKYGADSGLILNFTEPIFSRRFPKFFLDRGIDPDQSLLQVFKNFGFHEILADV